MAPSSSSEQVNVGLESATTIINNASNVITDASHPFYIHTSDSPGMRRAIVITLSAKNKLGFIDGSHPEPDMNSKHLKAWNRCNDMVIFWLLNSLSKEITESVIYSKSARDIWNELEDRFGQCNGAQLYQLQKELSDLVQGNSDIVGYYTKVKKIWDELDTLNTCVNCSCKCSCGGKENIVKFLQDGRLIQFLMGLNDAYAPSQK
ncbi:uncharacterized protein LOC142166269 [Nicotiana tabacum]|uniref:Uncharacterized protein LOC142166269 n=1 Tax=Nicotiana tabacum TaxID=4097 RepID=A0AC58S819_TOBAC